MERPSRQATALVLVGLSALAVALHDGLALLAPIRRVLTRADPLWLVLGGVAIAVGALLAVRRYRRGSESGRVDTDPTHGVSWWTGSPVSRCGLLPAALSVVALVAVVVGVHTESLIVAAASDYVVQTGWDGPLNYQELELVELAALGVLGTLAAVRWRRAAYVTVLSGALVLVYPSRFFARRFASVTEGMAVAGGSTIEVAFGAEPYLLVLGGLLLVLAGVAGVRGTLPGAGRARTLLRSSAAS